MATARSAGCAGADGKELLAFFVEPQTRKWVAWTPSGYYMASPGGEDLIGWHINRGWDAGGRILSLRRSSMTDYYRPDIVQTSERRATRLTRWRRAAAERATEARAEGRRARAGRARTPRRIGCHFGTSGGHRLASRRRSFLR